MQEPDRPSEQIEQIHAMMARSTTFVSLSGMSGVFAGLVAFGAVWLIYRQFGTIWLTEEVFTALRGSPSLVRSMTGIFLWTLLIALTGAFLFTWRRASRLRIGLWNIASRRFGMHLSLPLLAGGVFILALLQHGAYELVCPAMLVFFGLALLGAAKYSFSETAVFGVVELVLGLVALFWIEGGLILWEVGFGVVTAAYGLLMYLHYGR